MKAASKFFIKGVYLILVIIAVSIVINQIISVNQVGSEELDKIKFREKANNILETLLSSEKCLAMNENGTIEKIINVSNLGEFESKYPDIEPECARDYDYGYYVKIEKFNFTKFIGKAWEPKIPTGKRDIVLILDNSASMNSPEKFPMTQSAARQLIKCSDNQTDRVSIVVFSGDAATGDYCGVDEKVKMSSLSTQASIDKIIDDVDGLNADYGTPLVESLKIATEVLRKESSPNKFRMIILFTDGRETCCDTCSGTKGTSDCLTQCENKLCELAKSDLSFLKTNNISIYSIFLGNDQKGIEQTSCTSKETGGEFYNISDAAILPKLFCEIVAKGRETDEDYQTWYFGSKNHSTDKALKDFVTISIPISIKISDEKIQPGQATIRLYKGELEELTGLIDRTCKSGLEIWEKIYISYPVKLNGNSICMNNAGRINCRNFACNNVDFDGINSPGMYDFHFKKNGDTVKVVV